MWIPSRTTVQVTHKGKFIPVNIGDDHFDLGYLQAVNWLYHKEREFAGRKDIEHQFESVHFAHFEKKQGDTVMFVLEHSTIDE